MGLKWRKRISQVHLELKKNAFCQDKKSYKSEYKQDSNDADLRKQKALVCYLFRL